MSWGVDKWERAARAVIPNLSQLEGGSRGDDFLVSTILHLGFK